MTSTNITSLGRCLTEGQTSFDAFFPENPLDLCNALGVLDPFLNIAVVPLTQIIGQGRSFLFSAALGTVVHFVKNFFCHNELLGSKTPSEKSFYVLRALSVVSNLPKVNNFLPDLGGFLAVVQSSIFSKFEIDLMEHEDLKRLSLLLSKNLTLGEVENIMDEMRLLNIHSKNECNPLLFLANSFNATEYLLNLNAYPNPVDLNKRTPLILSILEGNFEVFKLFLNHPQSQLYLSDRFGLRPFDYAMRSKSPVSLKMVELLFEKNVIENAGDLNFQVYNLNSLEKLFFLSKLPGFDVNQVDETGSTLLLYAAKDKNLKWIKILFEMGADLNLKNKMGETPFDYL